MSQAALFGDAPAVQAVTEREGDLFSLRLTIAGAVRGKSLKVAQFGGHSSIVPTTASRNEMAVIRHEARLAMEGRPPFDGPIVMHLSAYRAPPSSMSRKNKALALAGKLAPTKKPDLDNATKMVDALNKICWTDDAVIVEMHCYKRYSDQPRLVIQINSWVG